MKATAPSMAVPAVTEKSRVAVFAELVKARLTVLVLLTTLVGFYMGSRGALDYAAMLPALVGTALLACGAAALNQLWEMSLDAKMRRTADRPLPSGRVLPRVALSFGSGCGVGGIICLAMATNPLTALLGAVTFASYLFIYTPLKRRTWLNTLVGAVPGALPPLMGWTAARNEIGVEGLALFGIQYFWQVPHFLAIAWIYREDYARAGFLMLPTVDPEGVRTSRQALNHSAALLLVSLAPVLLGMAGPAYFFGALVAGLAFVWFAIRFAQELSTAAARRLFFASILYLPLLFGMLVMDRWK